MRRHFLGLYLLIVLTLAAGSWAQDWVLRRYASEAGVEEGAVTLALASLQRQLAALPAAERSASLQSLARQSGVELELFKRADIAGGDVLGKLARGEVARLAGTHDAWAMKQLDADTIMAMRVPDVATGRSALDWAVTLVFYAAIALVLMLWIWPLRRDLRALESAAARYGDRNWVFDARIRPRSQVRALADTFRRMAQRIDGLIASQQDMTNAVAHEIRTPLARMLFEIELAQQAGSLEQVHASLDNLKSDLAAINEVVTATLNYAILERANVTLNLEAHDFRTLVPALVESIVREARPELDIGVLVADSARAVVCDAYLFETMVRNLLYNAARYARQRVQVRFGTSDGFNCFTVDDDGPGVPAADRERVFESFVQLAPASGSSRTGFGLGLAIVKRLIEWHGGTVAVSSSPLGGARFSLTWPEVPTAPQP